MKILFGATKLELPNDYGFVTTFFLQEINIEREREREREQNISKKNIILGLY